MNKIIAILLSFAVISITGCNQGGGTTVAGAAPSVSALSLSTTQITVNSDNLDSATITATVLDSNNAIMENVTINFTATSGQLSAASGVTDSSGSTQITFTSGSANPSNQTVTIIASAGTTSATIPIQITGNLVSIFTATTTLTNGGPAEQITVLATDALGNLVANTPVTLTMLGTGTATLSSSASGITDSNGELTLSITGTVDGTVTLTASALGTTASEVFTVATVAAAFQIIAPTVNPTTTAIGGTLVIDVNVPTVRNVTFSTSIGTWAGNGLNNWTTNGSGTITGTLNTPSVGTASITVSDDSSPPLTDTLTVNITNSIVSIGDTVTVTATPATIPISSDVADYTSVISAEVTSSGSPVSDATVIFSLSNIVGGGENVDPSFARTDSNGVATTIFTSGNLGTPGQGVTVTATLYDAANSVIDTSTIDIQISQQPGSVVLGTSTEILSDDTNTYYQLPMAVQVANTSGGPVPGVLVSLKVWPKNYYQGFGYGGTPCGPIYTTSPATAIPNEDTDKDTLLGGSEDINGDLALTPGNSAGGTIPSTVTTDANGIATFNLTYLKNNASWVENEITATILASGSETTGTLNMVLPYATDDCEHLPPSPFN